MISVLFLGYKDSGKTTAIEQLTAYLASHGKRVGVIKHVHGGGFEFSPKNKDTERFVSSGAHAVCALSDGSLFLYFKGTLGDALGLLGQKALDFVFIEGFATHEGFSQAKCVLCAKNLKEAHELIKLHPNRQIVCVTGALKTSKKRVNGIPVLKLPGDLKTLATLVAT